MKYGFHLPFLLPLFYCNSHSHHLVSCTAIFVTYSEVFPRFIKCVRNLLYVTWKNHRINICIDYLYTMYNFFSCYDNVYFSTCCNFDFTCIKTKCMLSHNNIIFIVSNLMYPCFTDQFMFIDLFWIKRYFVARWSHFQSECLVPSYNHGSKNNNNCNNKPNFFKPMHVKDPLKL